MHIHHAYVGLGLIIWSVAVIGLGAFMIGEYILWVAWGGLLLGIALFVHDALSHLAHRKRR